jgi:dGTPase
MAIRHRADRVLERIFARYMTDETAMPEPWRRGLKPADGSRWARRVCDFVAGMTDRFALLEHERLFDEKADLR